MSGHETPRFFDGMHIPGVTQCISPETANGNLKNGKLFCGNEGVLPPATPVNPYLRVGVPKYGPHFKILVTFLSFRELSFGMQFPFGAI